jgi:hypothetical protein
MHGQLSHIFAQHHIADLHRAAEHQRAASRSSEARRKPARPRLVAVLSWRGRRFRARPAAADR